MASWDDEEFEPSEAVVRATNDHWDGEDQDEDDLKDNWDDDEEEEKSAPAAQQSQPKKKKKLADIIKEKEEKKRQELLAKKLEEENNNKELTPEEALEEKLRRQRLQEESDLEIAKDMLGIEDIPGQKTIDNFNPMNKEEFQELSNMIVQKLAKFEQRSEYSQFLETLVRDCCAGSDADEIKKISNTLNLLVQEKQKMNKAIKGKKKTPGTKKTLASGKGMNDDMNYGDDYYNEFDDFM